MMRERWKGAREAGLRDNVEHVSEVLYRGIRSIITDAVMPRSERCSSRLELWRRLFLEMRGASPQIAVAQAEHVERGQLAVVEGLAVSLVQLIVLREYLERRNCRGVRLPMGK